MLLQQRQLLVQDEVNVAIESRLLRRCYHQCASPCMDWRMPFIKGNVATGFKRAIAEILHHISSASTKIASVALGSLNSGL